MSKACHCDRPLREGFVNHSCRASCADFAVLAPTLFVRSYRPNGAKRLKLTELLLCVPGLLDRAARSHA
jgi:hypothetical protein